MRKEAHTCPCNEDLSIWEAADKGTLKPNFSITILYTCGYSSEITTQGCVSVHNSPTHLPDMLFITVYCYSSYYCIVACKFRQLWYKQAS